MRILAGAILAAVAVAGCTYDPVATQPNPNQQNQQVTVVIGAPTPTPTPPPTCFPTSAPCAGNFTCCSGACVANQCL